MREERHTLADTGVAFAGHAMSSRIAVRSAGVHSTNACRSAPRIACRASAGRRAWRLACSGRSIIMKSMNSGTPASVALPGALVFRDDHVGEQRTVAYSCGVKNVGLYGFFAAPHLVRRGRGLRLRLFRPRRASREPGRHGTCAE